MEELSFCTTAMPRPDIVARTYRSFSRNLKNIDLRRATLYINIDKSPVPALNTQMPAVISVAQRFFCTVISRMPDASNFTAAFDWCWTSTRTEYLFNLQDDWELTYPINATQLIHNMREGGYKQAVFRAYKDPYTKVALSPSILHRDYYKRFAGEFDYNMNPELQLRKDFVDPGEIMEVGRVGIVKDIGRSWLKRKGIKRISDDKPGFIGWKQA
jgi:hypothetical protein